MKYETEVYLCNMKRMDIFAGTRQCGMEKRHNELLFCARMRTYTQMLCGSLLDEAKFKEKKLA